MGLAYVDNGAANFEIQRPFNTELWAITQRRKRSTLLQWVTLRAGRFFGANVSRRALDSVLDSSGATLRMRCATSTSCSTPTPIESCPCTAALPSLFRTFMRASRPTPTLPWRQTGKATWTQGPARASHPVPREGTCTVGTNGTLKDFSSTGLVQNWVNVFPRSLGARAIGGSRVGASENREGCKGSGVSCGRLFPPLAPFFSPQSLILRWGWMASARSHFGKRGRRIERFKLDWFDPFFCMNVPYVVLARIVVSYSNRGRGQCSNAGFGWASACRRAVTFGASSLLLRSSRIGFWKWLFHFNLGVSDACYSGLGNAQPIRVG